MQQALTRCNKQALVLPTHLGLEFVKILEKEGNENVHQDIETYYEINIAFVMRGHVPPYVVQQAKYAERCGLWKQC